jgi:hypothetical protein
LQAQAPDLPVNFARVKQPRAPRDPNQRVHVLAACLVLAVMGAGALLGMNALSKKRAELADKEQEVKDLTDHLTKERENAKLMLALHEWEGVPWPDELVELSARMPPISNSFKVRLAKGEVLKPQAPKGRPGQVVARPDAETLNRTDAAKFHLALDAPNDEPLRDLTLALQAVDGKLGMVYYRPMPHNESNKVFTKDIYIRKRPPEEYRREVP